MIDEDVNSLIPAIRGICDARVLASEIISKLACSCGGKLKALVPAFPKASLSFTLRFVCTECESLIELQTDERVKLYRRPELTEEEREDDELEPEERERARARAGSTTRLMLGALFAGNGYREFDIMTIFLGCPGISKGAWQSFLEYLSPFVQMATDESIELMQHLVLRHGSTAKNLICTTDTFWCTRGHYAMHSTSTICDFESAGILAFCHLSKDPDVEKIYIDHFEGSSHAMDPAGFNKNVRAVHNWVESLADNSEYDC